MQFLLLSHMLMRALFQEVVGTTDNKIIRICLFFNFWGVILIYMADHKYHFPASRRRERGKDYTSFWPELENIFFSLQHYS